MPPKTQVNSATGIIGVSGSGKSSLALSLAKYTWRRWKKILRYYSSDGGGFPAEVQAGIAAGLIEVFRMRTRDTGDNTLSFETCQRAAQGWWPKRIDPASGEVTPGVEMVPPVALQFELRCGQQHLMKTVPYEGMIIPTLCPTCKKVVTKQEMQVRKSIVQNRGFERVGGVFYDGLTSMLAWELLEMGHRAGRMELKGEESAIGGKLTSGDLKFGGSTRSHVGFVQARGEELVHLTLGIPNLVVPPVFTMLTHEDVDDRSLSIRGPKISGRAKTDEAPQWFGNMMEAAKVPATTGGGTQRTLFLTEFTDENNIRHLLKHRGSPGTMPDKLQDDPEGETDPARAFVNFNLGVFFELLDAALDKRIADVMQEFPDAPGLPEGIVEIGQEGVAPPPIAAQQGQAGPATLTSPTVPMAAAPAAPAPRGRKKPGPAAPPVATPVPTAAQEAPAEAAPPVQETAGAPAPPEPAAPVVAPPVAAPVAAAPAPAAPTTAPRPVGVAPPPGTRPTSAPRAPAAAPRIGAPRAAAPSAAPAPAAPPPAGAGLDS